jgi:hypothetical protein
MILRIQLAIVLAVAVWTHIGTAVYADCADQKSREIRLALVPDYVNNSIEFDLL